jgi:putative salt-induced outer membrane protein YdiY
MQQHQHTVSRLVVAGLATFTACTAFAQDAEPDPTAWQTSAGINLGLSRGNSDNLLVQGNVSTVKKWEQNEILGGLDASYGETTTKAPNAAGTALIETDTTNVNNYGGFLQYNRLLSERMYVGVKLDGRRDEIADIDYRFALTAHLGYYLIKEKDMELAVEAGPGYILEKLGGVSDDYATIRFGERWKWQFSKNARLFQDLEYLPRIDDWGSYVIQGQIGVEADLTKKLAMRVVLQDTYRSKPAPYAGTALFHEKNDLKLLAGITYKF